LVRNYPQSQFLQDADSMLSTLQKEEIRIAEVLEIRKEKEKV
jgi:outer membrane protein assembly factor BamD